MKHLRRELSRVRSNAVHVRVWTAQGGGGDPSGYADRVIPVLMGLLPGFIVQRAVIADFDADAYVAAIPGLLPH